MARTVRWPPQWQVHTSMPKVHCSQLWGTWRVGLPWASLLAFLRLVTNPRVFARPEGIAAAWAVIEDWLSCESAWVPTPTERHATVLRDLLLHAGTGGNLVPDAHLAALAIEHGLRLCTLDRGFAASRGSTRPTHSQSGTDLPGSD